MNSCKAIKIIALAVILASIPIQRGRAQTPMAGDVRMQKADFRGQRPQGAIVAAVSASRQDVVVVVVEGGDENLIAETEGNLKGLVRNGFTRLGLILCDQLPENTSPAVIIYSGGFTYAIVHDAKADAKTSSDVYKLVRDAYEADILPKLKPKEGQANGGF